jgi:hypothetical protein
MPVFRSQLDDLFAPRPLDRDALFRLFRRLLHGSGNDDHARLKYNTHLDALLADASIECHRDHLAIGDELVAVLTMKEPPARTFASVLDDLWTIPATVTACVEWRRLDFIRAGKPLENAFIESFNGKLRDECLNSHVFTSVVEAQAILDAWREDYNLVRPHSSLQDRSPAAVGALWVDSREARESTAVRKDRFETGIADRFVTNSPS